MSSKVNAVENSADAQVWNRLLALHAYVENRLATALQRGHGLGLSEYRALSFLDQAQDNELRMTVLADKVGLNQSSVTRLVGRLNAAEFTYRDPCPDDKRGMYTVLTDAGRARYREASTTYSDTLTAAFDEAAAIDPAVASILATVREAR
ncbi:MarR family winged helix-turn-helix transcriptional regulator [Nocardia tengchongensis]|uniref:MarR family winged helix-turn-helix transcriptional regulator n=1 Tax=Nocardia tengchongensis TaxID=2055889 RepID=UPI00361887CD